MLSSLELKNCIELLCEIDSLAKNNDIKLKLLEIGYVLKKEFDNVSLIEDMRSDVNSRIESMDLIDTKRLLEDNIQLFNEKERAIKQNKELVNVIESKLKIYESKANFIEAKVSEINSNIENFQLYDKQTIT
jgi:tRNA 2-selenouridine synthase SelU